MSTDAAVGVLQATSPDRYIDNGTVATAAAGTGGTAYRQRVETYDAVLANAPTLANVASSVTNVTLKASNAARRGLVVVNDSASATLYLKFGATASATSFTYSLAPGANWTMPTPVYTGIVDGIWSAAVGSARVTELT